MKESNIASRMPLKDHYGHEMESGTHIVESIARLYSEREKAYRYYRHQFDERHLTPTQQKHAFICGKKLANDLNVAYYDGLRDGHYLRRGMVWKMVREALCRAYGTEVTHA